MPTIKLKIYVAELTNVMSLYDSIQVQRSVTAPPATTPVDLTKNTAQPAVLVGTKEGPYLINGKTFDLRVNGTLVSITFVSPSPVALPDVLSEFNGAFTLASIPAVALSNDGKLQLETNGKGTQYTLEIISGSALFDLGFTVAEKDNGEASHPVLVSGTTNYEFDDGSGQASYYYRTRFYNTNDGTFSGWSDWVQGLTGSAVSAADLIVGKVKLAHLNGSALANKRVTIVNVFHPYQASGYGIFGKSVNLETDGAGMAETTLVKGSLVDVIFNGTSIIRRIQVPTTGTEFDLLDSSLVIGDELEIMVPDLPYAPRRS